MNFKNKYFTDILILKLGSGTTTSTLRKPSEHELSCQLSAAAALSSLLNFRLRINESNYWIRVLNSEGLIQPDPSGYTKVIIVVCLVSFLISSSSQKPTG